MGVISSVRLCVTTAQGSVLTVTNLISGNFRWPSIERVVYNYSEGINYYDKDVFELIEQALSDYHESQIDEALRKVILKAS